MLTASVPDLRVCEQSAVCEETGNTFDELEPELELKKPAFWNAVTAKYVVLQPSAAGIEFKKLKECW